MSDWDNPTDGDPRERVRRTPVSLAGPHPTGCRPLSATARSAAW
jgi:hypothetical protein